MSNQQEMSLYVRTPLDILSLIYRCMYLLFIQRYQYIRLCNVELLDRGREIGNNRGGFLGLIKYTILPVTFEE